ncbi:bifunctional methylenetetrahydrofolate dehydrogenase/methenyltetrahydrofolate cyclohydrolase [Candidatus Acetothermia bacterium]|nr:MAG: bifunctional methylenetetrahydrofolate dehydrogenase/methenyltetrahydrofolate cyclohydrolase [Candidatus Acetothermia bacterium]
MPEESRPKLLAGGPVAEGLLARAREGTERLSASGVRPTLAVVWVGEDRPGGAYLRSLRRAAGRAKVRLVELPLPLEVREGELIEVLRALAGDEEVHGVALLQPLPPHLDPARVLGALPPEKDAEGVHPRNLGRLLAGGAAVADLPRLLREGPVPATPRAVLELLRHYRVWLREREAVVVGGGRVGLPLSVLLLREGLSVVTVCDRNAPDLGTVTRRADVLCVAAGVPGLVKGHMIKPGATVVDVGVHVAPSGLVGDVEFAGAARVAGAITPVPGGVGPITGAVVVEQTVRAAASLSKEVTG